MYIYELCATREKYVRGLKQTTHVLNEKIKQESIKVTLADNLKSNLIYDYSPTHPP